MPDPVHPPESPAQIRADPGIARGPLRWVLMGAGFVAVGLAGLGVVLPLLPTTPFVLIAAACFARSSPRFHDWLLTNRVFGPLIEDWRTHRGLALRAKVISLVMIALVGASSIVFFVDPLWARLTTAIVLLGVIAFLLSLPTAPDRRGRQQT